MSSSMDECRNKTWNMNQSRKLRCVEQGWIHSYEQNPWILPSFTRSNCRRRWPWRFALLFASLFVDTFGNWFSVIRVKQKRETSSFVGSIDQRSFTMISDTIRNRDEGIGAKIATNSFQANWTSGLRRTTLSDQFLQCFNFLTKQADEINLHPRIHAMNHNQFDHCCYQFTTEFANLVTGKSAVHGSISNMQIVCNPGKPYSTCLRV